MSARPHLVLDGAELAAEAVGADRIVLYVGRAIDGTRGDRAQPPSEAVARGGRPVPIELVAAPDTYVAGEESAAVHYVNAAMPARRRSRRGRSSAASTAARPSSRTSRGSRMPRSSPGYGDAWYRELGRARRGAPRS